MVAVPTHLSPLVTPEIVAPDVGIGIDDRGARGREDGHAAGPAVELLWLSEVVGVVGDEARAPEPPLRVVHHHAVLAGGAHADLQAREVGPVGGGAREQGYFYLAGQGGARWDMHMAWGDALVGAANGDQRKPNIVFGMTSTRVLRCVK